MASNCAETPPVEIVESETPVEIVESVVESETSPVEHVDEGDSSGQISAAAAEAPAVVEAEVVVNDVNGDASLPETKAEEAVVAEKEEEDQQPSHSEAVDTEAVAELEADVSAVCDADGTSSPASGERKAEGAQVEQQLSPLGPRKIGRWANRSNKEEGGAQEEGLEEESSKTAHESSSAPQEESLEVPYESRLHNWLEVSWPAPEERARVDRCVRELEALIRSGLPDGARWRVAAFGSAVNGFGCRGSDLDVVAYHDNAKGDDSDAPATLRKLKKILLQGNSFSFKTVILHARVPVLKLSYLKQLQVDVSVNNISPLQNTRLLRAYASISPRVVELCVAVKLWAKSKNLCGAANGHLSSYGFIMLAIYFMQVNPNLKLPCLQCGGALDNDFSDDYSAMDAARIAKESSDRLGEDVANLLQGFFDFYASDFKWGSEVVSVRLGRRQSTESAELASLKKTDEELLHIEDPFDRTRNLRDVMAPKNEVALREGITDASKALAAGQPGDVVPAVSRGSGAAGRGGRRGGARGPQVDNYNSMGRGGSNANVGSYQGWPRRGIGDNAEGNHSGARASRNNRGRGKGGSASSAASKGYSNEWTLTGPGSHPQWQ